MLTVIQSVDLKNKRIGLIGGGSSGVQILPELLKEEGTSVSLFVRTPTYIANPFFDLTMEEMGLDPKVLSCECNRCLYFSGEEFLVNTGIVSEEQKSEFATDPAVYLKFRKTIEGFGVGTHSVSIKGSDMNEEWGAMLRTLMKERLMAKPGIADSLIPKYAAGCRRLIPGPGYLQALTQDNVDFYFNKLKYVTSSGVKLDNGEQLELDVIICATGFDSSTIPPFMVTGKGGENLQDKFLPYPETYMSIAIDNFPNYFMMMGPNSALGAGSLLVVLEAEGDYIIKCIRKLQKEDYVSMMPKRVRVDDFSELVDAYFKQTVYTDNCHSWYKNDGGKGERIIGLWPGSTTHALEMLRSPRWEDFEYESVHRNRLRWLGNGLSCVQVGGGDSTWYLNPEFIELAQEGTPEDDKKYGDRPFSQ